MVRVQDYDMRSDRVTFKTANGRSTVKADDLDNDSYRYVREWDALRQFSNPDNFRITLYDPEKLNTWLKYIWLRNPERQSHGRRMKFLLQELDMILK